MSLAMRGGPLGDSPAGTGTPAVQPTLYCEPTSKRVRGVLAGTTVVDSRRAALLYEPGVPARYLFPEQSVRTDLLDNPVTDEASCEDGVKGPVTRWDLRVGDRLRTAAASSYRQPRPEASFLAGRIMVAWDALDAWYEEDEQVFLEPRDPYHRVDCLRSSRHVVVKAGETVLAESRRPVAVFETGARVRFYVPAADVRTAVLIDSETLTRCQYKGLASYWSVLLPDGTLLEDQVWSYLRPNPEAGPIAGLFSFHHRGLTVTVDGETQ